MKKFLALLFVCAGLTAMAAAPQLNTANITKKANAAKVMKANTLTNELTSSMMSSKSALTPAKFFKQNNVTPADNRLARKAPRRLTDDDVAASTYLCYRYLYTFNDSGYLVEQDPWVDGSPQSVYFMVYEGTLYCAGYYWNPMGSTWYLPMDIDYTTNEVNFEVGFICDDSTYTGTYKNYTAANAQSAFGSNAQAGYYRCDTTLLTYLVNEQSFYNEEGTGYDENITGTLYPDGTIIFDGDYGYAYYGNMIVTVRYKRSQTGTASVFSNDTTEIFDIYRGTTFLVATGTHSFDYKGSGTTATTYTGPVYMFQRENTDTVIVWNLFTFGYPGNLMILNEDGTMNFPGQYVYDDEGADAANGDFTLTDDFGFVFDDEGYVDGFNGYGNTGAWTSEKITWPATVFTWEEGGLMYPFFNNVLTYTNGDTFYYPTVTPVGLRGDVNDDQDVTILDVTAMIDALLTEDWDSINYENADCNLDGTVTILDVTTLIDYLLTTEWPAAE